MEILNRYMVMKMCDCDSKALRVYVESYFCECDNYIQAISMPNAGNKRVMQFLSESQFLDTFRVLF